jgi:hypothetical protein
VETVRKLLDLGDLKVRGWDVSPEEKNFVEETGCGLLAGLRIVLQS